MPPARPRLQHKLLGLSHVFFPDRSRRGPRSTLQSRPLTVRQLPPPTELQQPASLQKPDFLVDRLPLLPILAVTNAASQLRIYNTLTKEKEPFEPLQAPKVGIYLCGPTVYAESHMGHMVGPVIFDTIKRYLRHSGYQPVLVVNITDVDDKLINKSHERGIPVSQIATEMTADYLANLRELGVNQIDYMPRATDHMDDIIDFIRQLIEKGFAYEADGDVFFDVVKDPNYGQLSNRNLDDQLGEGGGAAAKKRSAGDFALWKSAKPGEISWESPWGQGRPGWHIECSAMSHKILGDTFDIHGGGLDLMFPHHENELAQSSCCHNQPMVKYWMHNGLMRAGQKGKLGGKSDREQAAAAEESVEEAASAKISRSKGDGGLSGLIQRHTGTRIRFFLLRTHYRSTILFSEEGLEEAGTALDGFYRLFDRFAEITGLSFYDGKDLTPAVTREEGEFDAGDNEMLQQAAQLRASYLQAMDDDFNTGLAVSSLFDWLRMTNRYLDQHQLAAGAETQSAEVQALITSLKAMKELTTILGLFEKPPAQAGGDDDSQELLDKTVRLLIDLRKSARENKDYATGDAIRDRLGEIGIALLDKKEGTSWERQ
ncbi:Cysteine--tRNA ligase [Stieleria bergensis]|uniref:Cysteine--tRNA ligase n=1 Tax=Stieleria bergensis TaxID=2528025 RepID=A0A517SQR3_9BACT|nr:MAG: cysteine--tRNA ligase [Rhodopirellula sp. TMED11]QDT58450.1 Cysteine--tRNA ligase [Planctomycetes bacterium SV_7m_r]